MAEQEFSAFIEAASDAGALVSGDLVPIVRGGTTYSTDATGLGGGFTERATASVTSPISLTSGAGAFLTFDTEVSDTASMIDLGSQPTRITIPADGEYDLNVWGYFASNSTGVRIAGIYLGGVALIANEIQNAAVGFIHPFNVTIHNVSLDTGNYLQVSAYQNSGGALNLTTCVFNVRRVA